MLQVTNARCSFVFLGGGCSYFLNQIISLDSTALRKLLNVKIIDDEEYEKNKTFTIVLEEPILLEVGQKHGERQQQQQQQHGHHLLIYWLYKQFLPSNLNEI